MTPDALFNAFQNHHDVCVDEGAQPAFWLSVNCLPDPDTFVDDLARTAALPNDKMRVTTVEALRGAGYEVVPTPKSRRGHCDVWLSTGDSHVPSDDDLQRLSEAFSEAVPNPAGKKYRP